MIRNRLNRRCYALYGWTEQNEASYGLRKLRMNYIPSLDENFSIQEDGQINGDSVPEGCWYLTFGEAKKVAMKIWRKRKELAIRAISQIKNCSEHDL